MLHAAVPMNKLDVRIRFIRRERVIVRDVPDLPMTLVFDGNIHREYASSLKGRLDWDALVPR